jgi:hypothetical protein
MHNINPLKTQLNPICYLLALLGAHHILHVSRIRVKQKGVLKQYLLMKICLHVTPFRAVSMRIYQPLHPTLSVLEASAEVMLWEGFSVNLQSSPYNSPNTLTVW